MTTAMEQLIKVQVMGEIFNGNESCPEDTNTYDFFMRFECEGFKEIYETELGNKWDYQPCDENGLENIRGLRGLMQSKFNEYALFLHEARKIQELDRGNFMEYFRSDMFSEELSVDDKIEVFMGSLGGESDITKRLLDALLGNYNVGNRIEIKEMVC